MRDGTFVLHLFCGLQSFSVEKLKARCGKCTHTHKEIERTKERQLAKGGKGVNIEDIQAADKLNHI